ncbi:alpha/beta fold hydrolase [Streptomyces sp. NPDC002596]|uniref:alpha/beta fold hydrolase n=1 Tax=Streptomyces TaxID=1883 RepID=UPI0016712405|nr:alpha/beta hydrolase [Streptomyces atratus]GGT70774.1 alpha/beta hydrolase [Streptomyces atratus]
MSSEGFQHVKVGDIDIAYVESGQGEPLVLLHGGESHRGQFDAFRPLLGAGILAISFDQRDTGDTLNGPEPYDIVRQAADCADFLAALGFERAHVMGVSYGGAIAMHLAIHYPQRVASLILSGATPSWTMTESLGDRIVAMGPDARAQFALDLLLTPEGQANDPQLVADTKRALRGRPVDADARRMTAIQNHDCTARLHEITAPTLVLHGAEDPIVRAQVAELMASEIPGARLVILPRTRHGITFEAREQAARLARDFVLSHAVGTVSTGNGG